MKARINPKTKSNKVVWKGVLCKWQSALDLIGEAYKLLDPDERAKTSLGDYTLENVEEDFECEVDMSMDGEIVPKNIAKWLKTIKARGWEV